MSFKIKALPVDNVLQSKGNLLDISQPRIMGIINTNPDSFVAESRKTTTREIVDMAGNMISEGASIIDIGGVSTRPGSDFVSEQEEADRVLDQIEAIHKYFPDIWISTDTFRSAVAEQAVKAGAHIINDISGGSFDPAMIACVAGMNIPFIIMHLKGDFDQMHKAYTYNNITLEVCEDLSAKIRKCEQAGIKDIIVDPGFGFSKNVQQNFTLLNEMASLRILGKPILAGLSRKSMIWKTLTIDSRQALNGTTALHMAALQQGASLLRVHDVKEANEVIQLYNMLQ